MDVASDILVENRWGVICKAPRQVNDCLGSLNCRIQQCRIGDISPDLFNRKRLDNLRERGHSIQDTHFMVASR
jgi:hypothetical protein